MERRKAVKALAGKALKWWKVNWITFVTATGHPLDRTLGPQPWDTKR